MKRYIIRNNFYEVAKYINENFNELNALAMIERERIWGNDCPYNPNEPRRFCVFNNEIHITLSVCRAIVIREIPFDIYDGTKGFYLYDKFYAKKSKFLFKVLQLVFKYHFYPVYDKFYCVVNVLDNTIYVDNKDLYKHMKYDKS